MEWAQQSPILWWMQIKLTNTVCFVSVVLSPKKGSKFDFAFKLPSVQLALLIHTLACWACAGVKAEI